MNHFNSHLLPNSTLPVSTLLLVCSPEPGGQELREVLLGMDDIQLLGVLSEREREDLEMGYRERVNDMDLPHVAELPQVLPELFAGAAANAEAAGFDGVELHYAHAYTMASFLSAQNDRSDGYGGSREHRVRLPLEVFHTVRERVSSHLAVGCRFLGHEVIEGGSLRVTWYTSEEATESIEVDGQTFAGAAIALRKNHEITISPYPVLSALHTYTLTVTASDASGNTNSSSVDFFIEEEDAASPPPDESGGETQPTQTDVDFLLSDSVFLIGAALIGCFGFAAARNRAR